MVCQSGTDAWPHPRGEGDQQQHAVAIYLQQGGGCTGSSSKWRCNNNIISWRETIKLETIKMDCRYGTHERVAY
jgi:hypothetical protein